jgi:NADPH-dependent 2,4-dienoyl-CoA reductase/sulfur reductase-like enzyme
MASQRIVVVGAVAAGAKAAATARRRQPEASILVLQNEADVSYSACGMPYHLAASGDIPRRKLIARTADAFRADGIDMRTRHHVQEIDAKRGIVQVQDLDSGRQYRESFDHILVATGASPVAPQIPASASAPPMMQLRTLSDADALLERMPQLRKVVILGGGYIGLEMAETARELGLDVELVEMAAHVAPTLDERLSQAAEDALRRHGVRVHTGRKVVHLDAGHVGLDDGSSIPADMVLAAVGARPSVGLAEAAGVKLGPTGAIAVTPAMGTNLKRVWAAGDCAESRHVVSGRPVWLPLGDVANRHGRVAGTNMAGGKAVFPGVLGTAIFKVFDVVVGRTGLTPAEARAAGLSPVCEMVEAPSRARYMKASRPVQIHVTIDQLSGRILGAQVAGPDAVDKLVDTLATAIWGKLTVSDLLDLDLAYAPPFSPVFAPVQVCGEVLGKARTAAQRAVEQAVWRYAM